MCVCACCRQVRWLFNNEPVTSPHFRLGSRPDGTHTLHIAEVFDEDAGRFSVLAENDAGKVTSPRHAPTLSLLPPRTGWAKTARPPTHDRLTD